MELHFICDDQATTDVFREVFAHAEIELHARAQRLEERIRRYHILLTPGNAYGVMDGGFDQAVVMALGSDIQDLVLDKLRARHQGYLAPGGAVTVPTDNTFTPYLVYCPTMVIPRPYVDTTVIYQSYRAGFVAARRMAQRLVDPRMAFTAHGCGTGGLDPKISAQLAVAAYRHVFECEPPNDWETILRWEQYLQECMA